MLSALCSGVGGWKGACCSRNYLSYMQCALMARHVEDDCEDGSTLAIWAEGFQQAILEVFTIWEIHSNLGRTTVTAKLQAALHTMFTSHGASFHGHHDTSCTSELASMWFIRISTPHSQGVAYMLYQWPDPWLGSSHDSLRSSQQI